MKRFFKAHKNTIIETALWFSLIFEVAIIIILCIFSEVHGSHESDPAVYERFLEDIERYSTNNE